jgi:hypothetical protein
MNDFEKQGIINYLAVHPQTGVIIQDSGGIRKFRWAYGNRDKSSGVRVIYYFYNKSMPLSDNNYRDCILARIIDYCRYNNPCGAIPVVSLTGIIYILISTIIMNQALLKNKMKLDFKYYLSAIFALLVMTTTHISAEVLSSNKLDKYKTLTAIFEPANDCELSSNIIGEGSISGLPKTKECNQELILKAIPQTCYKFKQWRGACSGKMPTCEITLDENKSVIAEFEPKTFTLTTNAINCTIIRNPNNEIYNCSSTVQLSAIPNQGFEFFAWKDHNKVISYDASISIPSNEDINIIAECVVKNTTTPILTPQLSQIYTEEKVELTVVHGVPPYTWSTTGGQLSATTGEKVHFSANTPGNYQVTVTDKNGATFQAFVEVYPQLSLSPQYIHSLTGELSAQMNKIPLTLSVTPSSTMENPLILFLGEDIRLTVKGGVAPYNWTVTAGTLSSTQGKTVTYIAPKVSGEQTITVTDKNGNKVEIHR